MPIGSTVCQVDAGTGSPCADRLRRAECERRHEGALRAGRRAPAGASATERRWRSALATMRGVDSHGMLCSARELGLSDDQSGLLASILAAEAPVGRDVRDWLQLDDNVFTIKLTPNRADCLSVLGRRARSVAALTRSPAGSAKYRARCADQRCDLPGAHLRPAGCGRFTGRVIRNVERRAPAPRTGCASAWSVPASAASRRWWT